LRQPHFRCSWCAKLADALAENQAQRFIGFAGFVVVAALSWIALGALVGRAARPTSRAITRASALILTLFAGLIAVG